MTSHELARQFLSLPDRPVLVEDAGCFYKLPTSVTEATLKDGTEIIFVHGDPGQDREFVTTIVYLARTK